MLIVEFRERHIRDRDQSAAIEIRNGIDRRRRVDRLFGDGDIRRVDDRLVHMLAGPANQIAEIKHIRYGQSGGGIGLHRDLEPLVRNGTVREQDLDSIRTIHAISRAETKPHNRRGQGPGQPIRADFEHKIRSVDRRTIRGIGHIDDDAVDPLVIARVICECGGLAREQRRLVRRYRRIVPYTSRGGVMIVLAVVVEDRPIHDGCRYNHSEMAAESIADFTRCVIAVLIHPRAGNRLNLGIQLQ